MDIAISGLASSVLPGVDRNRQLRVQPEAQNRSQSNTRNDTSDQNNPRNERVVRGEVVSIRSDASNRTVNSTQRSVEERESTFNQSSTRRFSLQAAIQTFKDNEALIAAPGESRQVSGIIDEFV